MLIRVSNKHIENGIRANGRACPVALALKEATGKTIGVGYDSFFLTKKFRYPKSVGIFVRKYDRHEEVKPFNFVLKEI
jgi:hypothetical protein